MKRSEARSEKSIEFARAQRRSANEFATTVWLWIRGRQMYGAKFRRESPVPPYTLDFCCVEYKLDIEVDGENHFTEEGIEYDRRRDAFLRKQGYKILRIPGYVIRDESESAVRSIKEFVKSGMEE